MKRYINATDGLANLDQYTKLSFGRNWYSVHYNLIDTSPEADAHQMWLDFQASVSPIKPYDDAEYAWAQIENGHINVIKGGKVIQQYYYFDADDIDVENTDWCDAVIDLAIHYLEIENKDVTPRIIHNSTNIASEGEASITASADGYVYTYCDNCGKKNRVKVHFKDYFSPFDDIEYKCPYCGGRNLLHDPHIYDESGHVVNASEDTYSEPAEVTNFKKSVDSADNIDRIQFLIYELSDGDAEKACQVAYDTAVISDIDDIDTVKAEVISAIDTYLEDNKYGWQHDLEPSQYFTRDDINEFGQDVALHFYTMYLAHVKLVSVDLEGDNIKVTVAWEGNEATASAKIDMRKIRKHIDLFNKYAKPIIDELTRQLEEFGLDTSPHYNEDDYPYDLNGNYNPEPAEVTDFKHAVGSADTIDDIQFLIYELSDGVAEEACQVAFDAAVNSDVGDIDTVKNAVISAIDMYLEDNKFIEASQKLDSSTDKKLTKLKDEILSAVKDVMMSPNFGFLEDEVNEYSFVDVYPEGRVEVRAEVDYDGLMELVSALNPIIQKYDKDSYFEPVEPGIIEAYLHI